MCSKCDRDAIIFAGKEAYCELHALDFFEEKFYDQPNLLEEIKKMRNEVK